MPKPCTLLRYWYAFGTFIVLLCMSTHTCSALEPALQQPFTVTTNTDFAPLITATTTAPKAPSSQSKTTSNSSVILAQDKMMHWMNLALVILFLGVLLLFIVLKKAMRHRQ